MIHSLAALLIAMAGYAAPDTISGIVTDAEGNPIPKARVFLEPGIGGILRETSLSAEGHFVFEDVPMGLAGVFAAAPGHGYAGRHINVTLLEDIAPVTLALPEAATLGGKVVGAKGKPIQGARITRVALMGEHKVSIPLSKLRAFDFTEPVSGEDGGYVIEGLPKGAVVALKVGHARYALEGVGNAHAGDDDFQVTLHRGVFVEGDVLSRDGRLPVANATILITNAQPPHATSITRTDQQGVFSLRLKPGVYSYRASGTGLRSSGGERLVITGEPPHPKARLLVAGTGFVRGAVKDAATGAPIPDAQVHLYNNGNLAAITRTGAAGEYRFAAIEGENRIRVERAPGYAPPKDQAITAHVVQGRELRMPEVWLAPIPAYVVDVIGEDGAPVPGAVVTLLRPRQFGLHVADRQGRAVLTLAQVPGKGGVIGLVEDPARRRGAVFRIERRPVAPALVQLFPYAAVEGAVVSSRGRKLEGAIVGGVLSTEEDEPLLLWRTLSGADGVFAWRGVVPGVPQHCAVWDVDGEEGVSAVFNLAPGTEKALGRIVVQGGGNGDSLLGKRLEWRKCPVIAGGAPPKTPGAGGNLVVYCAAGAAAMVIEGLDELSSVLGADAPQCTVIVESTFVRDTAPFPVLEGRAPGRATTYLLDAGDRVVLETFGLPPLFALRGPSGP